MKKIYVPFLFALSCMFHPLIIANDGIADDSLTDCLTDPSGEQAVKGSHCHRFRGDQDELWAEISQALNRLMYDTAQLFRFGQSGDPALIQDLLNKLMSNFSDELDSFQVFSPITIDLHNKEAVRQFYLNDATTTYAGYVLHQMSNVQVKDTTNFRYSRKRTAEMKAFQVEYARINAPSPTDPTILVPTNILVVGDYTMQWIFEDGRWKVKRLRIDDDRIYLLEPLTVFQRNYSGPGSTPVVPFLP